MYKKRFHSPRIFSTGSVLQIKNYESGGVARELRKNGFETAMVRCTAGGVRERDIDPSKTKDTVSCNPAGQAFTLEQKDAEFIIEAGLCMGHDVIFHQTLKLPFKWLNSENLKETVPQELSGL